MRFEAKTPSLVQPLLTVQRHLIAGSTARQPQSRKYDAVRRPGLPGCDVATLQGIAEGDSLTLLGEPFSVVAVLPETGTVDDSRIFGHLHTVQRLSGNGRRRQLHRGRGLLQGDRGRLGRWRQ